MKDLKTKIEVLIDNSEYDQASLLAMSEMNVKLNILGHKFDSMDWDKDGQKRYIFDCELERGKEKYRFDFGTSIADSCIEESEWDVLNDNDLVEIYAGIGTNNYKFMGSTKFSLMKSNLNYIEDSFIDEKSKEIIDSFQKTVGEHNKNKPKCVQVHYSVGKRQAEETVRKAINNKINKLKQNKVTSKSKSNGNPTPPSSYDVLCAITKYDPETFEDFCSSYGYDEDSRSAEKTYRAVKKEYNAMKRLFSQEELEILSYIS